MALSFKTSETFVSVDGVVVSYSDLFEGAVKYIDYQRAKWFITKEDAEDLKMQAIYKLLKGCPKYDTRQSSPKTFGNRVAKNCYSDFCKKNKKGDGAVSVEPLSNFILTDRDDRTFYSREIEEHLQITYSPEDETVSRECIRLITDEIDALDERDREMVWMTSRGMKPRDISAATGDTQGATSVRIHRSRKKMDANPYIHGLLKEYGLRA